MIRISTISLLVVVLLGGCTVWIRVNPRELEKFSRPGGVALYARPGQGHVVAVEMVQLTRPDGTLINVHRNTEVRVTQTDQQVVYFTPPLQARVEGDTLHIRSANHPPTTLPLARIASVEVIP